MVRDDATPPRVLDDTPCDLPRDIVDFVMMGLDYAPVLTPLKVDDMMLVFTGHDIDDADTTFASPSARNEHNCNDDVTTSQPGDAQQNQFEVSSSFEPHNVPVQSAHAVVSLSAPAESKPSSIHNVSNSTQMQ